MAVGGRHFHVFALILALVSTWGTRGSDIKFFSKSKQTYGVPHTQT